MLQSSLHPPRSRQGATLLVVLALLALFALVGVSFVYYADSQARSTRNALEAQSLIRPDSDPELLLAYFLGQLIYDCPDDVGGVYSAMRGHSLARSMYGCQGGPAPALAPPAADVVPYSGTGRLHAPSPFGTLVPGPAIDDYQLINYTYYPQDPQLPADQRFLRDPERLPWRPANLAAPRGPYTGGFNAPYTYPDLNNVYLAAVRADGTVLLPSFHRPWAAAVDGFPPDAGQFYDRTSGRLNPFWAPNPSLSLPPWFKYTTLRPVPALNPGFPPPEDAGGDVKNLIGTPGGNDSIWLDMDFPVLTASDGRKYRPLFAPLMLDLDSRVNLNVHGNVRGPGGTHVSNQGWGPWEVNLGKVLPGQNGTEWQNVLRGKSVPPVPGRYGGMPWRGQYATPGSPGDFAPPGLLAPFYSQVDFDGYNERTGSPSSRLLLPGRGAPPLVCFPSFTPEGTYGGYGNRSAAERRDHPLLYNFFSPVGQGRRFAVSNMEALLRHGDTGSEALTSELLRLCPASFGNSRVRRLVTTHSFDVDRPGISPWVFNPAALAYPYEAEPTTDPDQPAVPQGPPIPFPALTDRGIPPFDQRLNNGEFGGVDWRALSAALGRVDLNRPLPPYPHQGSGRTPPFGPPLTRAAGRVALTIPFDVDAPHGPIWNQFILAQQARQQLADDVYRRLLVVTGVPPILPDQNPQAPAPELLRSRRWLAQLAVNIVDYLDEDDISTPFNFYTAEDYKHLTHPPPLPPEPDRVDPTRQTDGHAGEIQWPLYWVFGTELPRVVVNEALAESRRNDPDDASADTVRVFVELHSPLPRAVPAGTRPGDSLPVPLHMGTGAAAYTPYRVLIGVRSPVADRPTGAAILPGAENDNVLGNPELAVLRGATTNADFLLPLSTIAGGGQPHWPGAAGYGDIPSPYVPPHGPDTGELPQGFLLLGPPETAPAPFPRFDPFKAGNNAGIPKPTPLLRAPALQYSRAFPVRQADDPPDERTEGVTVVLRRLANPYLPFDGRRRLPHRSGPNFTYNPYVTVDYLEDIPLQPVKRGVRLPIASRGRLQPYAAHRSQLQAQTLAAAAHLRASFGRVNIPAPPAYDWLTHLDRQVTSPMELVHVSGYQPYQLTQRFVCPGGNGLPVKFSHRAPWLDEGRAPGAPSARLYRLFELLEAGPQAAGVAAGGRIPGKINVNTVWDPEILRALWDAQPSNYFRESDVDACFTQLLYGPALPPALTPRRRTQGSVPGAADRPFWGLAVGTYPPGDSQFPSGGGIDDSVLRLQPPPGGVHPYLDSELLTKGFNHLTTRSNVFAVWLTVGFFEVTDDTVRPVKLGAEIGRAQGRHVRHRMFAIVDRTNLSIASFVTSLAQPLVPPSRPHPIPLSPVTVAVGALSGTTPLPVAGAGIPWGIEVGTTLVVDTGADQEFVEVLAVDFRTDPPSLTAVFTRPHSAGAPISLANTPGAPPVFLKPVAVTGPDHVPQPPYVPQLPYPLTVRLSVDPARSNGTVLAGDYEDIPWQIRPGAKLVLGVGPNQEVVRVTGPFVIDSQTATGSFRAVVTRPHADGFVISNTLLGNPGPRPRFNPRDIAFAAVVRYLSIIE